MDYYGFSYRITYSYRFFNPENGETIASNDVTSVCFSNVFYFLKEPSEIHAAEYVIKCKKHFVKGSGNFCALSKEEIDKVIRYMRKTMDIEIKCKEDEEHYLFYLTVIGKSVKHKFILTFCRVFYEFPYNEFAKEVFRVRKLGTINKVNYSNKSFMEIYHMINHVYSRFWGGGHSLFIYPSLTVPSKTMKKAFKENRTTVQSVYNGESFISNQMKHPRVSHDDFYIDYWTEDGVNKRVKKYSENFNILKEIKNERKKNLRRRGRKAVR